MKFDRTVDRATPSESETRAASDVGLVLGAALLGGALVFLCCTRRGQALVSRTGAWLDELGAQARHVQSTAERTMAALEEGQRALQAVANRQHIER